MKRPPWGLGGLLFLFTLLAPSFRADGTVPVAQQQCFQVKYLLRQPQLEALAFVEAVKSLQDINSDDEDATRLRITALTAQAANLRRDEAQAFSRLAPLLKTMGATPSLQAWVATEAGGFSRPLKFTKDEAKQAKTEPEVATILATLDETDSLTADTTQQQQTLGLWMRLTQGGGGLWAADVGDMAAFLHTALAAQRVPRVSVTLARHLWDTAPTGTPASVRNALGRLVPQAGNLGDIVPIATTAVSLPTVAQAYDALLTAFDPRNVLAVNPPPASASGMKAAPPSE